MLIKFFSKGKGAGAGPVGYLVAPVVLAYDANRDLIRDADGQPLTITRDPLPDVLRGDPTRTEALIDASKHQWTYRAGVISFAVGDAPNEEQQAEVMDGFEQLAFAGLDGEQYDMLWVRHSHEGRVELHFCTPRLELTTGRSLNIAPPGYQTAFDSLRDLMNKTHDWADPMELDRAQEVRGTIEEASRAQGREALHNWILDQISVDIITDRASMIEALTDAGFEIPRAGKNYLTTKDPETGERWRLKGEVFHDGWQVDPSEREAERGLGGNTQGARRLDGVAIEDLQDRYSNVCDARARYNRDRYPHVSGMERQHTDAPRCNDHTADADIALGDGGGLSDHDHGDFGADLFMELETVRNDNAAPTSELGHPDRAAPRRDLSDPKSRDREHQNLHDGGQGGFLHQSGDGLDGSTPDSLGTRFARVRRAVGHGLRDLSDGIARLGSTLDAQDRSENDWIGRLRDVASSVAERVSVCLDGITGRCSELRNHTAKAERELGRSENRSKTLERAVTVRENEHSEEWGL